MRGRVKLTGEARSRYFRCVRSLLSVRPANRYAMITSEHNGPLMPQAVRLLRLFDSRFLLASIGGAPAALDISNAGLYVAAARHLRLHLSGVASLVYL